MKNLLKQSNQLIILITILVVLFSGCRQEKIITSPDNENSILEDNTVIADLIKDIATNDGSIDNIIDFANCFRVKFPVTVITNGREIVINFNEDLDLVRAVFDESSVDTDMIQMVFPVTVILTDYTEQIINNQDELDNLSNTCNGENEPDDDIECIDFLFPVSFTLYNTLTEQTNRIVIQNDNQLFQFVKDLTADEVASLNFPVTLILSDNSQQTVTNLDELEDLIERVKDDCDEDDDFDYLDNSFSDTQNPSTPTNLVATNTTETTTDLSWDSSSDNIDVTTYGIYIDGVLSISTSNTSLTINDLTANTAYVFTVIARDAAGNISSTSNEVSVTTLPSVDVTAPSAPLNLQSANTTQTTTDLSWDAATDNIAVISYDVYNNGTLIGSTDVTSYNVTGLTASTSYTFTVIARDAAGNSSANSNQANVTTLAPTGDTQSPVMPLNLSATNITSSSIDLTWDASSDNIGVIGYEVYVDGSLLKFVHSTVCNVTDLTAETSYTFTVLAKDAEGNSSALSNSVSITTLPLHEILDINVITVCSDWSVGTFEDNGDDNTDYEDYIFNFASDNTVIAEDIVNGGDAFPGTWSATTVDNAVKFKITITDLGGAINANWIVISVVRSNGITIIELNSGKNILRLRSTNCN